MPRCGLRDQLRDEQSYLSGLRRVVRVLKRSNQSSKGETTDEVARVEREIEIWEGKIKSTRAELTNGCAECEAYHTQQGPEVSHCCRNGFI